MPRKKKYSDDELKTIVSRTGLINTDSLKEITGYSNLYLNQRFKTINEIKKIDFTLNTCAGSRGSRLPENGLLDGLHRYRGGCCYYIDEARACEIIVQKLNLNNALSRGKKHRFTTCFRNCLTSSLSERIRKFYVVEE